MLVLQRTGAHVKVARPPVRPEARLAAARTEAWEGRDPKSTRVLLSVKSSTVGIPLRC